MSFRLCDQSGKFVHGCLGLCEKRGRFFQKACLYADIKCCTYCFYRIDGLCKNGCVTDDCRDDLLGCNIHHGLGLDVDGFCITFVLNLCSGLKLCSCEYIEGFKQLHCLVCSQCRNSIYHGRKDRKSTSLCLSLPLRCISVSVEYNTLMLRCVLFDQVMYCGVKIFCCFQTVACLAEYFCRNGVQYNVALGNRITGTYHTELEFVSCECKR